jgi:NADPH:quinone reductase-like Zn-dependent oxidoreductase
MSTSDQAVQHDTMWAVVQDAYGSVDVFRTTRIARPTIADDEVLVRVHAAGVDRGTWHLMTGRPYLMRIIGFGFRRPKNRVPGLDVAGTVVSVGAKVTRFAAGDEVFGISRGSYAEYAAAQESKLAIKPADLTYEQAAAVPVSSSTAHQALFGAGHLEPGQKLLVNGASGGVGTYAVQLGKAHGAEVTGVCSTSKLDLVRSLGADHVVDYTQPGGLPDRYDLILDIGGNTPLRRLRRALTPTGTIVFVGGESGGNVTGGLGRQMRAALRSPFVRQRFVMLASKERYEEFEKVSELITAGSVVPSIERTYPLDGVAEALQHLEDGNVRGKLVITVLGRATDSTE